MQMFIDVRFMQDGRKWAFGDVKERWRAMLFTCWNMGEGRETARGRVESIEAWMDLALLLVSWVDIWE